MGFKEEIKKISCTLNNTHTASLRVFLYGDWCCNFNTLTEGSQTLDYRPSLQKCRQEKFYNRNVVFRSRYSFMVYDRYKYSLWRNWGECCRTQARVGQTPVVHATDPYYHLTYDHITPVARRLRFYSRHKGVLRQQRQRTNYHTTGDHFLPVMRNLPF